MERWEKIIKDPHSNTTYFNALKPPRAVLAELRSVRSVEAEITATRVASKRRGWFTSEPLDQTPEGFQEMKWNEPFYADVEIHTNPW